MPYKRLGQLKRQAGQSAATEPATDVGEETPRPFTHHRRLPTNWQTSNREPPLLRFDHLRHNLRHILEGAKSRWHGPPIHHQNVRRDHRCKQ